MSGSPAVLDANVVLRYLVADDPDLHRKAAVILEAVRRGERAATLREVALAEIVFVLRRVYRVEKRDIVAQLRSVLNMRGMQSDDLDAMKAALDIFSKRNVSITDALILAHAIQFRLALATFDRDLQKAAMAARLKVIG